MNTLIRDLKQIVNCEIIQTQPEITALSQDFGRIIAKQPQIIIRPQSAAHVAQIIKYAGKQGLTITSRGAGHSLSGQSLNQGGILLDMRQLNQIYQFSADELWFSAGAGVTWQQIVNLSLKQGVIPPVLTNNFEVTLGGTLSAAGLGLNSFLYGSQADNCLGLEVVTGTGDILWCTPAQNQELFYHVLCGYGQFGIITKAKNTLRKCPNYTRSYFLCYDNLDNFLNDQRALILNGNIHGLVSLFSPCFLGLSRAANQIKPLIKWFYRMQITQELNSLNLNTEHLISNLNFSHHIYTEDLSFDRFIQPIGQPSHSVNTANPWIDVLLPAAKAQEFINIVLESIPDFLDFRNVPVGGFALNPSYHNLPMFPIPNDDLIFGLGMYPTVPKSQLTTVLKHLNLLTDLGEEMGAKRYMATWINFNLDKWRSQFGNYWLKINQIKQKYDPNYILNPGFFEYEHSVN